MNEYKASNGVVLLPIIAGGLRVTYGNGTRYPLPAYALDALREFFQHERDEELGRWRWPENLDYVVYPVASEHAVVWDERRREAWHVHLDIDQPESVRMARDAFRAYLAAHSEPKPWHDAKPGEAWVITVGGKDYAVVSGAATFFESSGLCRTHSDPGITAGRRIWPEAVS